MPRLNSYLPNDRLLAIANGTSLPGRPNGSALFADVSGFTPLTEKLTQQFGARRGIETLTQQINAVYTALVREVEEYKGEVISFAGDAITCWFEESAGDAPSLRAVSCAQAMQSAMALFPDISIKISVTTGTARRMVVGDPNIQLMDTLAGNAIARLATGDNIAHSGEILLDEETEKSTKCKVLERRTAETGECFVMIDRESVSASNTHIKRNTPAIPLETIKPWIPPAVYEREIRGHGFFLTELRPTVAMFVRFMGIDYDNDVQADEKLNTVVQRAQKITTENEGALLQLTVGDKGCYLYISFGIMTAHENDAQRAVQTAIKLNQFLKGCDFLDMHQIGLSSGVMRTGAYGSRSRQTYGALGDDVNLAARLMTIAASGEILISSRVQKSLTKDFIVEPRPPLLIKGKSEPIPVFAVAGKHRERATRLTEPVYQLPMIGREEELSAIEKKLENAIQGKGQVIGITADAGMGKSRLVAEVIHLARKCGFIGYGGTCQSSGTATPYLVWLPIWQAFFDLDPEIPQRKQIRLVESEVEERAPEHVEAIPLLSMLLDLPLPENDFTRNLEPKDRKNALEVLLEKCLKSAASETPLLIVLEDLHWIDPLSNDLLETLTHISENLRVCFVLAYRPPDQVRYQTPTIEKLPYFTKIELKYLTASDAEQFIHAKLAQLFPERTGTLPKALIDELIKKSQGNPFFIEEIVNYIHDRGLNPYDPQSLKALELPASLQTLILSRIDQLTEPQKVTLKVASVIGRVFPFSWLYGYYPSLGEESKVRADLAELSKVDLTPLDTPDPELAYLFKHIVTQEVAYESLSYAARAQLHELLAKYLEDTQPDDPPLDALSFHYSRSENISKKREYLRRSAEAAYEIFSNTTALENFKQALALSPGPNEAVEMHIKVGTILQMMANWDEALTHYQNALEIAENNRLVEQAVESQIKISGLSFVNGNLQQALDGLNKVYDLASNIENKASLCGVLTEIGGVQWRLGNFEVAIEYAQRGLEIARQIDDRKREAASLFFLASIYSEKGEYANGREFFEAAINIGKEVNDARRVGATLLNLGTNYYFQGDYKTAEKYIQESLDFYREIGEKRGTTIALNNLGNIFYLQNDYQTARQYYNQSLSLGREMADSYTISIALASLGITAFQEEKLEEADQLYCEAMTHVSELKHKVLTTLLHCYQGLLSLARKEFASARKSFEAGLTATQQGDIKTYFIYNLIGFGCLYEAEDKPSQAVTTLSAATSIASSIGFKLEPELQRPYEAAFSSAKRKLSETEFLSARETGAKMDIPQAAKFALTGKNI